MCRSVLGSVYKEKVGVFLFFSSLVGGGVGLTCKYRRCEVIWEGVTERLIRR